MKKVEIALVNGSEGFSLQIWGKNGGCRFAGPKAWGNPTNKPTAKFEVDVKEVIKEIQNCSYEVEENK